MKKFLNEILSFENLKGRHWILIFSLYLVVHIPVIRKNSYQSNLAVFQAEAFLRGHLNIDQYLSDVSVFEGQYYVCFPPLPAIIMTPLVAVFGSMVNSILVSLLFACFSLYLMYALLTKLMADSPGKKWVFVSFFFGSGYWWVVLTSDHINGFAHVICTCLLIMLLIEILGRQRPLVIGLLWSFAFLTRQMTIFYGILIIYFLVIDQPDKKKGIKDMSIAFIMFFAFVTSYLFFNYFRFHAFLDSGYNYLIYAAPVQERINNYGLFSTKYFFYNFYHLFLKGHSIIFSGSMNLQAIGMDQYGTSLLAASPYVIFSIKAQQGKKFKLAFWATILSIMLSILFYHNNGWMQVNTQRFSLDFLPALMVLIALSYDRIPFWLFKLFTIYAVGLNILSFIIHGIR